MSPSSYTHISVRDLYISMFGLPILLQENMWTDMIGEVLPKRSSPLSI
jgi:hypothetical protein